MERKPYLSAASAAAVGLPPSVRTHPPCSDKAEGVEERNKALGAASLEDYVKFMAINREANQRGSAHS